MKILNKFSGHVSELVAFPRDRLRSIQQEMQDNPHDPIIRQRELNLNKDYSATLA